MVEVGNLEINSYGANGSDILHQMDMPVFLLNIDYLLKQNIQREFLILKMPFSLLKANAKEFNIDTSKVAILGCSSGGQMAALVGTTNNNVNFEEGNSKYNQSSEVNAIIDIDGILAFKHPESEEGEMASLWLGGNSNNKLETWTEASALTHTNKNTPPILFIGSQYPRFLAGKDDMIEILNKYGIYNQVETIENSPHTFWLFHPWFKETVKYITDFLDKILKEN